MFRRTRTRFAVVCLVAGLCGKVLVVADERFPARAMNHAEALQLIEKLERECNERVERSPTVKKTGKRGKDGVTAIGDERYSVIKERCGDKAGKEELIAALSHNDLPPFADEFTLDVVHISLIDRDRESIVRLIAHRCPVWYGTSWSIEGLLVCQPVIPDGLLMLCDAFDASTSTSARAELAQALRRALQPLGVVDDDDQEMVLRSREWYAANKDKVQQNLAYSPYDNFVNRDGVSVNVRDGVFVPQADLTARQGISMVLPLLIAIALIYTGYKIWRNPRKNEAPRTR